MRISIIGLGYVGAVTGACLARRGHHIVGVDIQPEKVASFDQGASPIVEPGLDPLLKEAKARGLLRGTLNAAEAVASTDVTMICVGTPSTVSGAIDLSIVRQVIREFRATLRSRPKSHTLVIRSTVLPGSTARLVSESLVELEASGSLSICFYPDFLREGSTVEDFENPGLVVVGTRDGVRLPPGLTSDFFGEGLLVMNWQMAEMLKYSCNVFHATKIAFANEIGRMAKAMELDGQSVMELLCRDTKLNLAPYYLRPGNPFGGSCLPKDVRAFVHHGRIQGMHLPLLENVIPSNERHLQGLLQLIVESGQQEVVILGLSFKEATDDLRESPMVEVAQALLGRGYQVRIFDPQLNLGRLMGSNKRAIDARMPHLASFLREDLAAAIGEQGLVIAAQRCVAIADLARVVTPRHRILDVNGWTELRTLPVKYEGFCW